VLCKPLSPQLFWQLTRPEKTAVCKTKNFRKHEGDNFLLNPGHLQNTKGGTASTARRWLTRFSPAGELSRLLPSTREEGTELCRPLILNYTVSSSPAHCNWSHLHNTCRRIEVWISGSNTQAQPSCYENFWIKWCAVVYVKLRGTLRL
jgi:hypothetical protein